MLPVIQLEVRSMQPAINNNCSDYSDEILLQSVVLKESGAFEMLYDRHASNVYSILLHIVRDESLAEELLQETFWQVWQKAGQYNVKGTGSAWLHQIARNKALDQLRRQKVRLPILANDIEAYEWAIGPHQITLESEFEQGWTREMIHKALERIPNEQRLCLEMAYFEGLSQQEIAEKTQTPLGTIKTRMRMGLEKIERLLLRSGLVLNPAVYLTSLPNS